MKRFAPALGVLAVFISVSSAQAAPFSDYSTQPTYTLTLPAGGFVLTDAFPLGTAGSVDGYPLGGHLIAVTGQTVFLQNNFGSGHWLTVATVDISMDPSFVKVSRSGAKVALGVGYGKPLHVFAPSVLSASSPPDLSTNPTVKTWNALNYYDAAWLDDRHLFINAGEFVGSEVYALDTQATPPGGTITVINNIPGASSGVTFDGNGNLITGIGWGSGTPGFETGQLKVWSAAAVQAALAPGGTALDYQATGAVLAEVALSAAFLGVDDDGNLHVGGGDVFGTSGNFGYAVVINHDVITRVLAGGAPADPTSTADWVKIAPDPCQNDDSVQVQYVPGIKMLVVSANLASQPPNCASTDWSGSPSATGPTVQLYFPPDAPDTDGDGIPDGADNAYLTPNPDQADVDGDGFGDAAKKWDVNGDGIIDDKDLSVLVDAFGLQRGDAGFNAAVDFDNNGVIDFADFELLRARWRQVAPFY